VPSESLATQCRGSPRQEDFLGSLGGPLSGEGNCMAAGVTEDKANHLLYIYLSWAEWYAPVIPAAREAKEGEL
jgi:hypothetical protein